MVTQAVFSWVTVSAWYLFRILCRAGNAWPELKNAEPDQLILETGSVQSSSTGVIDRLIPFRCSSSRLFLLFTWQVSCFSHSDILLPVSRWTRCDGCSLTAGKVKVSLQQRFCCVENDKCDLQFIKSV